MDVAFAADAVSHQGNTVAIALKRPQVMSQDLLRNPLAQAPENSLLFDVTPVAPTEQGLGSQKVLYYFFHVVLDLPDFGRIAAKLRSARSVR